MKKFQFRLERVFRYHKQRLKQAELRLAQAAIERDAALANVRHCQQQIDRACQLNESVGSLINPAIRPNVMAHIDRLGEILGLSKERLKVAEQRVRETDQVRLQVTRDVEGLSQLRDIRQHEHTDEVNRMHQIELDEVVMRKWSALGEDDPLLSTGMLE